jgi:hypothetical protein
MAISKDLEPLIFKKFSARRQPWWRLEEFGPPNLECVPTPLPYCIGFLAMQKSDDQTDNQFPICNAKWLKNGKLRKAILSACYNISQRNIGILLILWCSFVQTCLDQNFTQKGKDLLLKTKYWSFNILLPVHIRKYTSKMTGWRDTG